MIHSKKIFAKSMDCQLNALTLHLFEKYTSRNSALTFGVEYEFHAGTVFAFFG